MHTCSIAPTDIPRKRSVRKISDGADAGYNKHDLVSVVINSFIASDDECIECFDDAGVFANSNNFRKSFQNCIKRRRIKGIYATIRGNRVFLVREGVLEDEDE